MPGSTKGMKKRTLVLGVAAALVAAGIVVVTRGGFGPRKAPLPRRPPEGRGRFGRGRQAVKKAVPLRLEALGTVTPIASVAIKARLETVITEVHFQDGAEVKAGRSAVHARRPADRGRDQARGGASSPAPQAQLEQAERDVQRYTELVAKNATTVVTLNNAQTQVNISRAHRRIEQRHAGKSQGSARLHQDPRADRGPDQRRQREGRQFRAASRHRAARDHHPDGAGLRHLHGAATRAARTCARRWPPRARPSRPSCPASTQARAAARSR